MSFEEPIWLYLTPLLFLIFGNILVYGSRRRDVLLGQFAASRLLDQLTAQASFSRAWIKGACGLLAVAAIGLALARPQYGVEWSERKARGLDIVFVLDSSKSMLATDQRPTRLDRAKLAIIDLVERLKSDRIGLIAFAGQAFLQTPPTLDYSAFRESLDAIDPHIMTSGGSDLGNALKEAAEAFPSENNVKVVVLLTDGEDLGGKALEAANAAHEEGIQVFAIGIGTPEGEYLKIRNEGGIEEFVRDTSGQPVRSQLDESTLQQIAQITGGSYSRLSSESLNQLYNSVIATLPREERESEMQEIRIERFQWALSAAAILLVLETLIRLRRSAAIHTSLAFVAALSFSPVDAHAQGAEPSDARSLYNSAYESLNAGDYEAANQLYESALSQSKDLNFQRDALYNMGHATYQQGRRTYESGDPQAALDQIKKAEQLFHSALEVDPDDPSISGDLEQIAQVRGAIEKLLEQQEEQQQNESSKPQDSEDSEDSDQSDQNQDQQGDQSDQEEGQEGDNSEQNEPGDQGAQDEEGQPGEPNDDAPQEEPSDAQGTPDQEQDGEQSQGAPQESTEDPVDDIPQSQAGEENENASEPNEQAGRPEPTEDEAGEAGEAAGSSSEPVEGMTEAEAAALLDSLRGKETLLPFIDQPRGGRQRDIRDW